MDFLTLLRISGSSTEHMMHLRTRGVLAKLCCVPSPILALISNSGLFVWSSPSTQQPLGTVRSEGTAIPMVSCSVKYSCLQVHCPFPDAKQQTRAQPLVAVLTAESRSTPLYL